MKDTSMAMSTAQRRGKPLKTEPTIFVENETLSDTADGGPISSSHSARARTITTNATSQQPLQLSTIDPLSHHNLVTAVVRRRYCGTGPFDRHWLNLDCCGLTCAVITYMLHLYAVYAICWILLPPWMSYDVIDLAASADANSASTTSTRYLSMAGHFHQAAFTTIALLAILSHFQAMTTDPGAVPPDAKPLPEPSTNNQAPEIKQDGGNIDSDVSSFVHPSGANAAGLVTSPSRSLRLCRRCKAYKPQRAHHCSVCRRCIIKMDHHCPWVNNCVGLGNHKYFLLFIFYTCLSCIYSVALVLARFATCMGVSKRHAAAAAVKATCLDQPSQLLSILGLLIEAILFGLFTSCMMCDQFDVIHSKMTHIDRLKGASVSGSLPGILEVFGITSNRLNNYYQNSNFRPDWLSPLHKVCFPDSLQDEVFGFCRPCTQMVSAALGATGDNGSPSKPYHQASSSSLLQPSDMELTRLADTV